MSNEAALPSNLFGWPGSKPGVQVASLTPAERLPNSQFCPFPGPGREQLELPNRPGNQGRKRTEAPWPEPQARAPR